MYKVPTLFAPFLFCDVIVDKAYSGGEKRVWCNSIGLFVLPDLQILEMLIGVDGVERPANEARVTLN